ncbi:MAG: hypothetical protein AAGI48_09785 [Verrucomicrobiota bacterium]
MRLLEILLALEASESERLNARSITFLQAPEAKNREGGIVWDQQDEVEGMFDSFGNPFVVFMNIEFEDTLVLIWGGEEVRLRGKQVAVASAGADGVEGTEDDVKTWN